MSVVLDNFYQDLLSFLLIVIYFFIFFIFLIFLNSVNKFITSFSFVFSSIISSSSSVSQLLSSALLASFNSSSVVASIISFDCHLFQLLFFICFPCFLNSFSFLLLYQLLPSLLTFSSKRFNSSSSSVV